MTQNRIELRLSSGNPAEGALIEALNDQGEEYGAKGRFLKERLLRGYAVILKELDDLMVNSDPMGELDRRAHTMNSKRYRVLRVLLTCRQGGDVHYSVPAQTSPPGRSEATLQAAVVSPIVSAPPEPTSESVSQGPGVTPDNPGSLNPLREVVDASHEPTEPVNVDQVPVAPQPTVKHDWSKFSGIAGAKGGS